ncbi:hypothetical protein PGTUg99_002333 [Puccinia graminis f. sp. tritici]|uniref:Uncharacterized protein n=1 Tax=Puccinia graminis f. sp. tritici TaxID=56615 RepID=A0A5B0S3S0_PUCGR|nr:hypothetical protein PGTUg99_002333 [Puccinia graminis f. sp. tritici]
MSAIRAPNHPSILTGLFEPTNEVNLITNTALNNILEVGALYLISGRFIALNDGSTPTLSYNHDTIVRVARVGSAGPEVTNRTSAVTLGHVVERAEVLSGESEGGPRLEVIVAHNDWDAITHTLYQVGREIQLLGHLVDFELERHLAVFAAAKLLVHCRQVAHLLGMGEDFPPAAQPPCQPHVDGGTSSTSLAQNSKGKQKASSNSDINDSDSDQDETTVPDSSSQTSLPNITKRGRPRKNILQEAAKRMKRT